MFRGPNVNKVTPVWLLKFVINSYFLALSTQQQVLNRPAITYTKLTIETLEQGVKYVQS